MEVQEQKELDPDEHIRFEEAVRAGFTSLDQGRFLEEAQMEAHVERLLRR